MKPTIKLIAALGMGSAAAALAYARYVERLWIDVRRLWVTVETSGLPPEGLRILHFSDMHFTGDGTIERWKIERTVKLLADHHQAADTRLVGLPGAVEVTIEALAHALYQQAHGFSRDRCEAFNPQDAVLGHSVFQCSEQARLLCFR